MKTAVQTEEILASGALDMKQHSLQNKASILNSLKVIKNIIFFIYYVELGR